MGREIETIEAIIANRKIDDVMYISANEAIWMPIGWATSFIRKNLADEESKVTYTNKYVRIVDSSGTVVFIE